MSEFPAMEDARRKTLAYVAGLSDAQLCAWPDDAFSPLCWHLGHLAFTEAQWALGRCGADPSLSVPFASRYAQDGCPKSERNAGYDREALFAYMAEVRARVEVSWPRIAEHELAKGGFLDWFLAGHEHQHRETIALVRALMVDDHGPAFEQAAAEVEALADPGADGLSEYGGQCTVGTEALCAYDNERPSLKVDLPPFRLADAPVRAFDWFRFMDEGGYTRRELWSDEGWTFSQRLERPMPRAWRLAGEGVVQLQVDGPKPLLGDEPVTGVSWYEASAFARWAGARLPTEDEWELACKLRHGKSASPSAAWTGDQDGPRSAPSASHTGMIGNVWEWTSTPFAPRPGFRSHPYHGYSEPYFDDAHYVLRGGSFATDPALATPTFRNWFQPHTRQVFSGLRLCYDL